MSAANRLLRHRVLMNSMRMNSLRVGKRGQLLPFSFETLVTILVGRMLSNETKRAIADLLYRSVDIEADTQQEYDFIYEVTKGDFPDFDKYLPNLIVTLNPKAPQCAVAKAVEALVRDYKTQHGIPEHRRRDDKLDEYLAVWDLREGWTNGEYDCSRELKRTFRTSL